MAYLWQCLKREGKLSPPCRFFSIFSLILMRLPLSLGLFLVFLNVFPGGIGNCRVSPFKCGTPGDAYLFWWDLLFCSCMFNESRVSTGIGAGIFIYSILVQMLARVGDKFANIKYATPHSFDTKGLAAETLRRGLHALYSMGSGSC